VGRTEAAARARRTDEPERRTGAGGAAGRDELGRRRLLASARRGDLRARAQLVERHLPLVRAVASHYRDYGLPLDDLVQEGSIGLLDAIDHYEPGRGPGFEPYARLRVRRAIRNALTDQARLIRLPKHVVERRRALERAEARFAAAGARARPADLAAATGISVAAVLEARAATQAVVSLDERLLPDGSPLESFVADPIATDPVVDVIEHERVDLLERAVAHLPERQRRIVRAHWGLNGARATPATDLAGELSLSARRTQAIAQDALHTLRHELELAGATR
jgi:RNA polymerase sigma factor (sigma-70 family)